MTPELENLRQQVQSMKVDLRQARRTRIGLVTLLAVGVALYGVVALAGTYDCSVGGQPFGLNCFAKNSPAIADEMNFNFKTVSDQISSAQANDVSLNTRVTALENAVSKLNNTTYFADGGVQVPRIVTGSANGGFNGTGHSWGNPVNVTFTPAFANAPVCVGMTISPDTSTYSENVVTTGTSKTGASFYTGQVYNNGTTLDFFYVCIGY